jgi:ubiquinone/menaquinone biosynthesis C-methylase UbiE
MCPGCSREFRKESGVIVLDDRRRAEETFAHFAQPLERLDSAFTDLTYFQLLLMLERLAQDPPTSLLVIGCDTGREFGLLAGLCNRISALDISFKALEAAAREHARLGLDGDVVLFDGHSLPYGDESFDIVLAHHVLHHIPDPTPMLSEMWRVCAREMVVCEPALTRVRRAVLALRLRPRTEQDGMRVHNFSISNLKSFAASHHAIFSYSLYFYPKPQSTTPQRWHRVVDRLRLRRITLTLLRGLNRIAGSAIGTKVTASFQRNGVGTRLGGR